MFQSSPMRIFTSLFLQMWDDHLRQLPLKIAETKKWRSGYWKNRFRKLVLDSDGPPNDDDPLVEEPDVSDPECLIEGSPPNADDARRGWPAEQHQR